MSNSTEVELIELGGPTSRLEAIVEMLKQRELKKNRELAEKLANQGCLYISELYDQYKKMLKQKQHQAKSNL